MERIVLRFKSDDIYKKQMSSTSKSCAIHLLKKIKQNKHVQLVRKTS